MIKKIINYFLLSGLLIVLLPAMEACDVNTISEPPELEVSVTGTLSGKPRENIKVSVYLTEQEARDRINEITQTQISDSRGIVYFYSLTVGKRYWISADAVLSSKVKETESLKGGLNRFSITIL